MHAQPQRMLKRLIKQYGQELIDDPRRTEALLRDLCGQHTREIFVIVNAQRLHVPSELQAAPAWLPYAAVQSRLTRQLQAKLALTEDAADWAIATWAAALDLTPGSQGQILPWGLGSLLNSEPRATPRDHKGQNAKSGVQSNSAATRKARRRGNRAELGWRLPALTWSGFRLNWPRRIDWPRTRIPGLVWGGGLALMVVIVVASTIWMARDRPAPVNAEAATPISAAPVTDETSTIPPAVLESLSLSLPGVYLREAWTLPAYAQVTGDGLFVREGPSVGYDDIAILQIRHTVHVVGFSDDGAWSRIDQPQWGWVNNDFLQFESAFGISVRLQVHVLQAKPYEVAVRQSPRIAGDQIGALPAESIAVAVGVSADGAWLQLAQPVVGWVAANDVADLGSP